MPAIKPDAGTLDAGSRIPEVGQCFLVAPKLDTDFREDPVRLKLDVRKRLVSQELICRDPAARLHNRCRQDPLPGVPPMPAPATAPGGVPFQGKALCGYFPVKDPATSLP